MSTFRIELDRPSGTYYAGEVVSGNLIVTPKNNETCRALQISMVGKSKIHWHTGSGDNRNDYDGRKVFLWHERTLMGNFYRTALLDETGEDAYFGGAVGDGDLYIPCLPTEGSNGGPMRLIVRCCDYDWGKRDDNIGEIVIDAKELASKREEVTFNLTRNGKPEQGNITLAAQFIPTKSITPSHSNGDKKNVSLVQSSETLVLKILKATELRKADWFGKNDVYVQAWRAPQSLTNPPPPGKKLPSPDKKTTLPHEALNFSFAFPTRADSPGSAALNCGDHAYIAYYIMAKIDKKIWKDPTQKFPVVILPNRPVPMPQLLTSFIQETEPMTIYKNKCCCFTCGDAGEIKLKLSVARRAYAPGEVIDLTGSEVDNDSTIPVTLRVVLRQRIQLATTGAYEHRTEGIHRVELASKDLFTQSSTSLNDMKVTMAAVPPSFFGAQGLSSAKREALTFTYSLSLQAVSKGGHKVKVDMPILVSALPPKPEAIIQASSISAPQINGDFDVQSYAVTDDRPIDTVTMTTGLEDSNGDVVPSVTGSINIYEHQEDSGSSAQSYAYNPQVVVFSSNNTEPTQLDSPTEVNDNVDHDTAFNTLLSSMAIEYDSRLAVDKWIKQYPSAASSLSADEFAGVLKKVLFSMEQGAVARELVSGLGSGVLNTSYIVAAMEACPFSKPTLVTTMAPYVSDPENKEIVLSELYSYERGEAEKAFAR